MADRLTDEQLRETIAFAEDLDHALYQCEKPNLLRALREVEAGRRWKERWKTIVLESGGRLTLLDLARLDDPTDEIRQEVEDLAERNPFLQDAPYGAKCQCGAKVMDGGPIVQRNADQTLTRHSLNGCKTTPFDPPSLAPAYLGVPVVPAVVDKAIEARELAFVLEQAVSAGATNRCPHCDACFGSAERRGDEPMVGILTSNPAKCGNCRKPVVGPPLFDGLAHRLAVALEHAERYRVGEIGPADFDRAKVAAALAEARKAGYLP